MENWELGNETVQLDGARGIFPLVPDLLGESVRGTWGEPLNWNCTAFDDEAIR
jgi:hypothetical protein